MRRRRFLKRSAEAALSVCFLPLTSCAYRKQGVAPANDRRDWTGLVGKLEKDIPTEMERAMLPGLSIALIRDAKIHWRRGFGIEDKDSDEPVDNETVFQAASMSKPVFAYAVMKLCEKGVMALDTPLTQYTRERFVEGDPRLDLITARRVLSHTTGFPNWRSERNPLKINFTPGEQFQYSGEGYFYLQSVVTRLTGKVFPEDCGTFEGGLTVCATDMEDYMKANVLGPFGMSSSGYTWNDRMRRHLARGHDRSGAALPHKPPKAPSVARYASAGALLTTPTDYARFLIEVIAPKSSGSFRLNEASLREMLRPHVKASETTSWALGWAIYGGEKQPFIGHGGDSKGFHSFAVVSVEQKAGYVIMTNGDSGVDVLKNVMQSINAFLGDAGGKYLATNENGRVRDRTRTGRS